MKQKAEGGCSVSKNDFVLTGEVRAPNCKSPGVSIKISGRRFYQLISDRFYVMPGMLLDQLDSFGDSADNIDIFCISRRRPRHRPLGRDYIAGAGHYWQQYPAALLAGTDICLTVKSGIAFKTISPSG